MRNESDGRPYVVVVGGANLDIAGMSSAPLVARDSNPGIVRMSHGGVGRNIAHNLALLGVDVRLVTVFGDDLGAESLKAGCTEVGIDISHSITVPGAGSSTYLFITDEHGEMELAINDMSILDHLSFELLESKLELMRGAAVCLIDTNLPRATLSWLTSQEDITYFCDPISTIKARRLDGLLEGIHTLKPNLLEAQALCDSFSDDPSELAHALLELGLTRVFLSLGEDGLFCADGTSEEKLPLLPCTPVNTTGAGDSMMAALVWAELEGLSLSDAARVGLAASALCVESESTVNPALNEVYLRSYI